jgi:hypothetical protein
MISFAKRFFVTFLFLCLLIISLFWVFSYFNFFSAFFIDFFFLCYNFIHTMLKRFVEIEMQPCFAHLAVVAAADNTAVAAARNTAAAGDTAVAAADSTAAADNTAVVAADSTAAADYTAAAAECCETADTAAGVADKEFADRTDWSGRGQVLGLG